MAQVSFYFDEMMMGKVAKQLQERGYSVIRAVEVGMTQKDDLTEHLVYATQHELVMVTFDRPFAGKASKTTEHAGLVCLPGPQDAVGTVVKLLAQFAADHTAEDVAGQVFWM